MDFLSELLFDITFNGDYVQLFIDTILFIGMWLLLLYLIYFLVTKIVSSKLHKDFQLKLSFLWALGIIQFLVSIYLFLLIRLGGLKVFKWNDPYFYVGILPQLIIFIGTIILFVNQYKFYKHSVIDS